jgi:hypothetical protein
MGYATILVFIRNSQFSFQRIGFNAGRTGTNKTDFFFVSCTLVELFKAFPESPYINIEYCTVNLRIMFFCDHCLLYGIHTADRGTIFS